MLPILGVAIFIIGYILCYQESGYREKYKIVMPKICMQILSLPAKGLRKIPVLNRLIPENVSGMSFIKGYILVYLFISALPTYICFFLSDVDKVAGAWIFMFIFAICVTNLMYLVYDILKNRRHVNLKILALVFCVVCVVIATFMCIWCGEEVPVYVAVTMVGTLVAYIVIFSRAEIELV